MNNCGNFELSNSFIVCKRTSGSDECNKSVWHLNGIEPEISKKIFWC